MSASPLTPIPTPEDVEPWLEVMKQAPYLSAGVLFLAAFVAGGLFTLRIIEWTVRMIDKHRGKGPAPSG